MTQIDLGYILRLLEQSEAFSDEEKETIKSRLTQLNDVQLAEFKNVLENEAKISIDYYNKVTEREKIIAQKKMSFLYNYAEGIVQEVEEKEIEKLDAELEALTI